MWATSSSSSSSRARSPTRAESRCRARLSASRRLVIFSSRANSARQACRQQELPPTRLLEGVGGPRQQIIAGQEAMAIVVGLEVRQFDQQQGADREFLASQEQVGHLGLE